MRTPEQLAALRTAVFRGIASGEDIKAIADKTGSSESYIYTVLRRSGYEAMYLSVEERWHIKNLRIKNARKKK